MKPINRISYLLLQSTRNNTVLSYVRSMKRRPRQPQVWIAFVSTRAANSLGHPSNPRTHYRRSLRHRTGCSPTSASLPYDLVEHQLHRPAGGHSTKSSWWIRHCEEPGQGALPVQSSREEQCLGRGWPRCTAVGSIVQIG
jgi:hypothetical protein